MSAKAPEPRPLPGPLMGEFAPIALPAPLGGFPVVHKANPAALTRHIDPMQLRDWLSRPTATSAAIQISGVDYPSHEEAKTVIDHLRSALVELTGCRTVEVSAPIAAHRYDGGLMHPLPSTFFAHNISEWATRKLKRQISWSTKAIAFFVYDLRPSIPELLFPLHGFTHRDSRELETVVKQTLRQPEYRNFTLSLALDNPEFTGQRPDKVFDVLMCSIQVRVIDLLPSGTLVANVYGKSPTTSPQLWCVWRDVLGDVEYRSSFAHVGRRRLGELSCAGCHGADHLLTCCPYEKILGWHGVGAGSPPDQH
ncbi:hypothetical protein C8Q79DRAFT_918510 [Trametes meyenii]|nr:hypothetical protein C8Q79DRAFT_918510 [Trametes meyenii]